MSVQYYRDRDLPFFELKLCDSSDLCYKKHAHEEYSLGIVDLGESSFWCEGRQLATVTPGSLVAIPPDVVHACTPQEARQWKYKMLFLQPGWVWRFMDEAAGDLRSPLVRDLSAQPAYRAVDGMLESLTGAATPLEKESRIMAVLAQLVPAAGKPNNIPCRKEEPRLRLVADYLRSQFRERITLDELEELSGMGKFRIIRSFKEAFKVPPHTYQVLLRINYAKKELKKSRPVADIAQETGFYDQSHFIKVFKGHTGVTPDRYQKLQ
ncbi:MAG: AraC family transcriptional regulator [Negativicutes bacterium]|nr:AraC family transcriptional regulator [Negativicutes bacterium]